jgi:hypothetical protein
MSDPTRDRLIALVIDVGMLRRDVATDIADAVLSRMFQRAGWAEPGELPSIGIISEDGREWERDCRHMSAMDDACGVCADKRIAELEAALRSTAVQCENVVFNASQKSFDNDRHLASWRAVAEFARAALVKK